MANTNPWASQPPATITSPPQPPPQPLTTAYPNPTIFGGIDGINATFTWSIFFPYIQVFRNGLFQTQGFDYGAAPTAITFFPDAIPVPGDIITIQGFGTL